MTQMKKWNYQKAVISGDTTAQWLWKKRNPELFITGLGLRATICLILHGSETHLKLERFKSLVK
jgi:hypothetical protein